MKKLITICLMIWAVAFQSCDDPFKNSTFTVYDVEPISSYLSTRPDDFSEWIKVLKYADMYNAINQAGEKFTAFVPTNKAVEEFYANKKVNSIEDLGKDYARMLVQYHVINDSIDMDEFTKGGVLIDKTLGGDQLEVTFSDDQTGEGGFNSLYINNEAHVKEFAIHTSNGYVYVLDGVCRPLVESIYETMYENDKNNILCKAMELTGWKDTLSIFADTITLSSGVKQATRRYYTILAVADQVYNNAGISSAEDLASKLGAGSDYTNKDNALNRYVAYHIIDGRYKMEDLQKPDIDTVSTSKLWTTRAENTLVKVSLEADGKHYLNYDGGSDKASFVEAESNFQTRNGYIQQLDGMLPICNTLKPIVVYWEPTNYPELANYIATNGVEYQVFQQGNAKEVIDKELVTPIIDAKLACYEFKPGLLGLPKGSFGNLNYRTCRLGSAYDQLSHTPLRRFLHEDALDVSLGYQGYIIMKTPPMIPGKYKVTLRYFYANTMNPFRTYSGGSNGGMTSFEFTDMPQLEKSTKLLYSSVPDNPDGKGKEMSLYDMTLYNEVEFTNTAEHPFKMTIEDPAADISAVFRIHLDYILFEPIN